MMKLVLLSIFLPILYAIPNLTSDGNYSIGGNLFRRLMEEVIMDNQLFECVPIIITGKIGMWTEAEHLLVKSFETQPYVVGLPEENSLDQEKSYVQGCNIFIIFIHEQIQLLHILKTLKQQNLMKKDSYYVINFHKNVLDLKRDSFSKTFEFLSDIPKCIIVNKFTSKYNFSGIESLNILKLDSFDVDAKYKKFIYSGQRGLAQTLFSQVPKSFNGITLNITLLEYFPCVEIHRSNGDVVGYSGFEINLLNVISKNLNFSVHYSSPSDGKWGNLNETNGKWNGMTKEIISGRANIAMSCIGVFIDRIEVVDFTYSTLQDCAIFVVPMPDEIPKWTTLGAVFDHQVWIGVGLTLTGCIIVVWFLTKAVSRILPENPFNLNLSSSALTITQFILQVSPTQHPIQNSTRFLIINLWIFTIITSVAYRSMLTSLLSLPRFPTPMNTLEELAESDLTTNMINYGGGWESMLAQGSNPSIKELWRRMEFINSVPDAIAKLEQSRKNAVMDAKVNLQLLIINHYTDPKTGISSVHLMPRCLMQYNMAWAIEKNSPYKSAIDEKTRRLVQAGFVTKWNTDLLREKMFAAARKRNIQSNEENSDSAPLSFISLQAAFVCLQIGILSSVISFVVESTIAFRIKKRVIK